MSDAPSFIVIGAARSGTTALYQYLQRHPDIFMSRIKEPNYFAFEGCPLDFKGPGAEFVNNSIASWEDYCALFANAPPDAKTGEASPLYLYSQQAPACIKRRLPQVKLIAILRNPIEQAYSHYLYARAQMIEPLANFEEALAAQPSRLGKNWQPMFQYSEFPRYAEQLARYFEHFDREKIKIFLYEDYLKDPQSVLREIFAFVGVDSAFSPVLAPHVNMGGNPQSVFIQWLIMRPNPISRIFRALLPLATRRKIRDVISRKNVDREEIPTAARILLWAALREDITQLQTLIGRDLSHWFAA